ncbi:MAG: hypothetical protein ACE5HL_05635 [Terriglobia bacterium]
MFWPAFRRCLLVMTAGLVLFATGLAAQEPEKDNQQKEAAEAVAEPVADPNAGRHSGTVVIPAGTHIPLVLQNSVSTKTAQVGDFLYFESVYPVVVNKRILVPVGSFVRGSITRVKRPGRIRGRGELHVRFDELTLPNGYTVDLSAGLGAAGARVDEEVDREEGGVKSDSSKGEDVATVAGAGATGAVIGAIAGRGKGVAIGGAAGAAAGLAAVLLTRGRELELARGTTVEIVLNRPLELDSALAQFDWTGQSSALPGPAPRRRNRRRIGSRIPF